MASRECGPKKRLRKALDNLLATWAAGALPDTAQWLLETSLTWLSKERGGQEIDNPDMEWLLEEDAGVEVAEVGVDGRLLGKSKDEVIRILDELVLEERSALVAGTIRDVVLDLIPPGCADAVVSILSRKPTCEMAHFLTEDGELERRIRVEEAASETEAANRGAPSEGPEMMETSVSEDGNAAASTSPRPKVRPIQMGELLRKFACKRMQAFDRTDHDRDATVRWRSHGWGGGGSAFQKAADEIMENEEAAACTVYYRHRSRDFVSDPWSGRQFECRSRKKFLGEERQLQESINTQRKYTSGRPAPMIQIRVLARETWTRHWKPA
jgi:hypothetical protein